MLIDKNNNERDFEISVDEETFEVVKEFKYLGALITNNYDDSNRTTETSIHGTHYETQMQRK